MTFLSPQKGPACPFPVSSPVSRILKGLSTILCLRFEGITLAEAGAEGSLKAARTACQRPGCLATRKRLLRVDNSARGKAIQAPPRPIQAPPHPVRKGTSRQLPTKWGGQSLLIGRFSGSDRIRNLAHAHVLRPSAVCGCVVRGGCVWLGGGGLVHEARACSLHTGLRYSRSEPQFPPFALAEPAPHGVPRPYRAAPLTARGLSQLLGGDEGSPGILTASVPGA